MSKGIEWLDEVVGTIRDHRGGVHELIASL